MFIWSIYENFKIIYPASGCQEFDPTELNPDPLRRVLSAVNAER